MADAGELALGFTPLGAVWDAGKAVAAALRGDWGEAALYTMAIAPAVGELTKGLKLARTFRYADEAADASRAVSRNVDEIADIGADIRRTADDLPTIRPRGTGTDGVPISTADDVASSGSMGACRANSFVPGTRVLMADGSSKPIEQIDLGDEVWAVDPVTGEEGPRPVTDLITGHGDKTLVEIEVDGETVVATDEHPIWVDSEGRWVDAEDVRPGDLLLDEHGVTLLVGDVDIVDVTDQTVHNLTVADIHTFFVDAGTDWILTHNTGGDCRGAMGDPNELLSDIDVRGPYKRPVPGTSRKQRTSVQGQACHTCGSTEGVMRADHYDPYFERYVRGDRTFDGARDVSAVGPQCAICSARQGAWYSRMSGQLTRSYKRLFSWMAHGGYIL